jgi:nitrate reductase NapE component
MEPIKMETTNIDVHGAGEGCPSCAQVASETKKNEEISMAFLLALVPIISLTFFGQIGLL